VSVHVERLTNRSNEPSAPQRGTPRPSSLLAKVVATITAAVLLGATVAAVVVGLLTFTIALLLLVPIVVLLLGLAIVAGSGKLNVYVQGGDGTSLRRRKNKSSHRE
jgi:hypothetical protein